MPFLGVKQNVAMGHMVKTAPLFALTASMESVILRLESAFAVLDLMGHCKYPFCTFNIYSQMISWYYSHVVDCSEVDAYKQLVHLLIKCKWTA